MKIMRKIYLLKNENLQFVVKAFTDDKTAYAALRWYTKHSIDYGYSIQEVSLDDFDLDFYSK